ncbi:MAG: pyridoxal phosphate-dependent aminotransferase [Rhodothermales bacterium]
MINVAEQTRFNPNVERMKPSATLAVSARATELKREGRPIVSLSAGEPDFDTPKAIRVAAIDAVNQGFTHYTVNAGTLELREAISENLQRTCGLSYRPDQILCSNGAKQSVALTIFTLCRPGDEVLIPAPYWVSYPEMVRMAGAEPVEVIASVEDEYKLHPDQLEAAITDRTRLLILCSPSNPTGAVYTPEELDEIARVLERHEQVYVLSDEIYQHIVYDAEFSAFATRPSMYERTITVNGFSKGYAMTGWRLGYLAGPQPIVAAAGKVQGQFTSAPSSITQKAGVAAMKMGDEEIRRMVTAFRERRDYLHAELQKIPGIVCPKPEGAFYLFPDVSAYFGSSDGERRIENSSDLCLYMMEEHNVAMVPGDAFGGPSGVRLSYAASMDTLRQAVANLQRGFARLH